MMRSALNLFGFCLVSGTLISLSSPYWILIWAGIEIRLLGLIPIILAFRSSLNKEGAVKYFVVQAIGSILVLAGSLLMFFPSFTWEYISSFYRNQFLSVVVLFFGLFIKLGIFPFHLWVPGVIASIRWASCLLILTWQKIAPLFFISYLIQTGAYEYSNFIITSCALRSLVGGVRGVNQTLLRGILAYSSITHTRWIGFSCCVGNLETVLYFLIYFFMSICLFSLLIYSDYFPLSHSNKVSSLIALNLFAIRGMPPFIGFIGKWAVLKASFMAGVSPLLIRVLILGSVVSLFFYTKTIYSYVLISAKAQKHFKTLTGVLFSGLNVLGFRVFLLF